MTWSAEDLDRGQTAMFDVVLDAIVPSLRVADAPPPEDDEDA